MINQQPNSSSDGDLTSKPEQQINEIHEQLMQPKANPRYKGLVETTRFRDDLEYYIQKENDEISSDFAEKQMSDQKEISKIQEISDTFSNLSLTYCTTADTNTRFCAP